MHKTHNTIKLVSSQHRSNINRGQSQQKQKPQPQKHINIPCHNNEQQQISSSIQSKQIRNTNLNNKINSVYTDSSSSQSRVIQLQLQLNQSRAHVHFLTLRNQELTDKLAHYEAKCDDMNIMEQQLLFRRQQQAHIQGHLDNYHNINNKLRQRVVQLQALLKSGIGVGCSMTDTVTVPLNNSNARNNNNINISINKLGSRSTYHETQSCQMSRQISRKSYLNDSKTEETRKSIGQAHKQNHPLTPKNKVSINFEKLAMNQIQSMHQIKERRKVFM